MQATNTIVASLELRFLIDRYIAARSVGHLEVADVYARAAEGLLTAAMPNHAKAISGVSSRKGRGRLIGSVLAQHLSPMSAAAIFIVWSCRQARRPAVDALAEAFRDDPIFNETIRALCGRILPPATPTEIAKPVPIETAAAYRR